MKYRPCVIVIHSPMYHGKTTVAELLAKKTNIHHFDLDEIKWKMFADFPEPANGSLASKTEENTRRTNAAYAEAGRRAIELYQQGIPSVWSGTFSWASFKAPFIEMARTKKVGDLKIYTLQVTSLDEIRRRIRIRSNDPNVDVEAKLASYLWSREQQTKAPWPEEMATKSIDAEQDLQTVLRTIMDDLESLVLE